MIIFEKLRYQNLLATGNNFTEIDFLGAKSTLVVGVNGAGKSSMIEALTYCLFGRAFRNINLPQLINSITNKGLLTEVDFNIGGKKYLVQRGMKPTVFKIFIDGEEQKSKGIKDDQKFLEENILKMNFKSFSQIVVLGATNYTPFMLLKADERRKIVENLLDIQIFTIMNQLLKNKTDINKENLNEVSNKVDLLENQKTVEEKHLKEFQKDNDEIIKQKNSKIKEFNEGILELQTNLQMFYNDISEKQEQVTDDLDKLDSKKIKLLQFETTFNEKVRVINKEIKFFNENDSCPTCKQIIEVSFKNEEVQQRSTKVDEYKVALNKLETDLEVLNDSILKIKKINQEISNLNLQATRTNQEISHLQRNISSLEEEIEKLKIKSEKRDNSIINELTDKINTLNNEKELLMNDRATYNVASRLLKDTGIKTKIIINLLSNI